MNNTTNSDIQSVLKRALSKVFVVVGVVVLVSLSPDLGSGQTNTSDVTGQTPSAVPSIEKLQKDFDLAVEQLRSALKAIKRTGADHYQNKSALAHQYREKWEAEAVIAQDAYNEVRKTAFALFFALDETKPELNHVIQVLNLKLIEQGKLSTCYQATKKLLTLRPADPELNKTMGRVSVMTNDFETATEYYKTQQSEIESFEMLEQALYESLEMLRNSYDRELELRKSDAQGEDLPHAIVETNKGTFVIELFENQAPETVGNFVSLVETGIYDGMIFHRAVRNILIETGKMTMNRPQPIGYTIYDETQRPDARHHFRGSVSMALNNNEVNSGAAEFRIMLVPAAHLNGTNTVFGRVISGLEVLDSIQPTFTINEEERKEEFIAGVMPDTIVKITLKRLRKHEYEPNRVER